MRERRTSSTQHCSYSYSNSNVSTEAGPLRLFPNKSSIRRKLRPVAMHAFPSGSPSPLQTARAIKHLVRLDLFGLQVVLFQSTNNIFLSHQISQQYFYPWLISQTSPNEQGEELLESIPLKAQTNQTTRDLAHGGVNFQLTLRKTTREVFHFACAGA